MSMFTISAAMNPNISEAELLEFIKLDGDLNVRLVETFGECLGKCETNEQRMRYFNTCMPILMQMIF